MTDGSIPTLAQWCQGPHFPRYLTDLLADAIARLRPSGGLSGRSIPDRSFGPDGLDLDSLERFTLAVAVAEALQLAQAEQPEKLQEMNDLSQWVAEARRSMPASAAVGFRTSGSLGNPKFVVHRLDALTQEVSQLAALLRDRARIVSVVPAHHIYGFLFTVLLPLQLGIKVVDARVHAPSTTAAMAEPGDLIVAHPTWWRTLTDRTWIAGVEGTSSGAPCPREVADELRRNGLRRLVEVYGSTETGGIGWRDRSSTSFALFSYWMRNGESSITKTIAGSAKTFKLPDHVIWSSQTSLTPVSRIDGLVQVGGVNVDPETVRRALLAHPEIADATVRLMRPEEGERLKAYVVPKTLERPRDQLRVDLETWVSQRLPPLERPKAFTFGAALPTTALGKPADWSIER